MFSVGQQHTETIIGLPRLPALWILGSRYKQNRDGADGGCWLSIIISNIVDLTMF